MAGGRVVISTWHLMLTVSLLLIVPTRQYEVGKCYCQDDLDDALQAKITAFVDPPTPPQYQYNGIQAKANDVFEPCSCSDVTRLITTFQVSQDTIMTEAQTEPAAAANTVKEKLDSWITSLVAVEPTLENRVVGFTVTFGEVLDDHVTFRADALFRGRDEPLAEKLKQAMITELESSNQIVDITVTGISDMEYSVAKCGEDPPAATGSVQRAWIGSQLTGVTATYSCETGKRLSNNEEQITIECPQADNQPWTWTALPGNLRCHAICTDDPPESPPNCKNDWDNAEKLSGSVVTYTCTDGYIPSSSGPDDATATCDEDGIWSELSNNVTCEFDGCPHGPPQVPLHGNLAWNNQRIEGTVAGYYCDDEYKSSTDEDPRARCENGTWIGLPEDWKCIGVDEVVDVKTGIVIKEADLGDKNYFVIITIPSVAGLIFAIIFILCCTRTDSPLFRICGGNNVKMKKPLGNGDC